MPRPKPWPLIQCASLLHVLALQALYGYAQAARVGSGIFIVIQLILMVTFVFQMNELLTHQWEMWWAKTLLVLGESEARA